MSSILNKTDSRRDFDHWSVIHAGTRKGNIKNTMIVILNCALRWGMIDVGVNPMTLVRINDVSKRLDEHRPRLEQRQVVQSRSLTPDERLSLVSKLPGRSISHDGNSRTGDGAPLQRVVRGRRSASLIKPGDWIFRELGTGWHSKAH